MKKNGNDIDGYEDGEQPLVFHYGKQGERLKHAEENVRKFYSGEGPQPPKGLFKSLIQTKTSRFMFFTVISLVLLFFMLQLFAGDPSKSSVSGIPVFASAFSFEDAVYISIKMNAVPDFANNIVPVNAVIRLYGADKQLINTVSAEGFYSGKENFLRTTVTDYDILYIEADLHTPDSSVTLTAGVTKN